MARIPGEQVLGSPQMFGARGRQRADVSDYGSGEGLMAIGRGVAQAAAGFERRQKEAQRDKIAAANLEYQVAITDRLYNPQGGYMRTNGIDARDGYAPLDEDLELMRNQIGERHGVAGTQEWDEQSMPARESARRTAGSHAIGQEQQAYVNNATAQITTLREQAIAGAADVDATINLINQADAIAAGAADFAGYEPEQTAAMRRATTGTTAAALIDNRLESNDYVSAQRYWETYKDTLNEADRTRLEPLMYEAGVIDAFTGGIEAARINARADEIEAAAEEPAMGDTSAVAAPTSSPMIPSSFVPGLQANLGAINGEGVLAIYPQNSRRGYAVVDEPTARNWTEGEAMRHGVRVTASPELTNFRTQSLVDEHRVRVADSNRAIAPYVGGITPQVIDALIAIESNFVTTADNPLSSAYGPAQFIESTWQEFIDERHPEFNTLSYADRMALREDLTLSREGATWYAGKTETRLTRMGISMTPGATYLGHFLGPGGAGTAFSANRTAMVADVMGSRVVRDNPFLEGRTVGWMIDWAERRMAAAAGTAPPPSVQVAQSDSDILGAASMNDDAWLNWTAQQPEISVLPVQEQLSMRDDPALQAEARQYYYDRASQELTSRDIPVNDANILLASSLPDEAISAVLKAPPNTLLRDILPENSSYRNYPGTADMTVRQLILWAETKAANARAASAPMEDFVDDGRASIGLFRRRAALETRLRAAADSNQTAAWLATATPDEILGTAVEEIAANSEPGDYYSEEPFSMAGSPPPLPRPRPGSRSNGLTAPTLNRDTIFGRDQGLTAPTLDSQTAFGPSGPRNQYFRQPPPARPGINTQAGFDSTFNAVPTQTSPASIVTVQRGDTLTEIAAANDVPLATLLELNPHLADNPDLIFPGERVYLAPQVAPTPPSRPADLQSPQNSPTPPARPADLGEVLGEDPPAGATVVGVEQVGEDEEISDVSFVEDIEALLDEIFPGDERAQGIAREYYTENMKAQNELVAEQKDAAMRQAEEFVLRGGKVDQMDVETLATLGHTNVEALRELEAGGSGNSRQTNGEALTSLIEIYARNEAEFRTMDLSEWEDFLSVADYRSLRLKQLQMRSADPTNGLYRITMEQALNVGDVMLQESGLDENAEAKAMLYRSIMLEFDLYQSTNKERPTPTEMQEIVAHLFEPVTVKYNGNFLGVPTGPASRETERFRVDIIPYEDIPDAERTQIENHLWQRGDPNHRRFPTPPEVEAAYAEAIRAGVF